MVVICAVFGIAGVRLCVGDVAGYLAAVLVVVMILFTVVPMLILLLLLLLYHAGRLL